MSSKNPIRATTWDGVSYGSNLRGKAHPCVRDVPCSNCGAPKGALCRGKNGTPTWAFHCVRLNAWYTRGAAPAEGE